jgi:hypothetical protein
MSFFKRLIDRPPKPDDFAELAAEAMRRCGWSEPTYDKATFTLRVGDGKVFTLNNAFDAYTNAASADRADVLDRWFATLRDQQIPERFEEARPSLLLMLRSRREPLQTQAKLDQAAPVVMLGRPFSDDLEVAVAFDRPRALSRVGPKQLQTWGGERRRCLCGGGSQSAREVTAVVETHRSRRCASDVGRRLRCCARADRRRAGDGARRRTKGGDDAGSRPPLRRECG